VTPDGELVEEFALKPQGIVKVISSETVEIPIDVTGYVHVKTSLCNHGVLALNIGIVDPGFSGPLQSTLINFGKTVYRVKRGGIFGRLTFHEQAPAESSVQRQALTNDDVCHSAKQDVDRFLAADFLNFKATVQAASKEVFDDYKKMLFVWVPVFAAVLACLTYFLNFGNLWRMERYIDVRSPSAEQRRQEDLASQIRDLESDRAALRDELADLRKQVEMANAARPVEK